MSEKSSWRWRARVYDPEGDGLSAALLQELFPSPSSLRRAIEGVPAFGVPLLLYGGRGRGKVWASRVAHVVAGRSGALLEAEPVAPPGSGETLAEIWSRARGGTLVLRELDRSPRCTQVELGELLDGVAPRVGLVAIAEEEPERAVAAGSLRRSLLDRTIPVAVEPLRCRPEDLEQSLDVFLKRAARKLDRPVPPLHDIARARLKAHSWPGDLAELERFADRSVALGSLEKALTMLADEEGVCRDPDELWHSACRRIRDGRPVSLERVSRRLVRRVENAWIEQVVRRLRGDTSRAATLLGLSADALRSRLQQVRP